MVSILAFPFWAIVDGHHEDGLLSLIDDAFGDTAHEEQVPAAAAARGEHDHIGVFFIAHRYDGAYGEGAGRDGPDLNLILL